MMHATNSELIIETKHGGRVPIFDPDPASIEIRDIAAGLARKFRWSGQADLTVAQHSVHVSRRLAGHEAQWGLMHDAAEAFLLDVPRPLKAKLMVYKALGTQWILEQFAAVENRLLRAIGERFGLAWPIPEAVHEADDRELHREARDLFGDAIHAEEAYPEPLVVVPQPLAENLFLRRFAELFPQERV